MILLDNLIKDERKINKKLYSAGSYWDYKGRKIIIEIRKNGLKNFRGFNSGVGTSFTDNLVLDVRKEFNVKGRILEKYFLYLF